MGIGIAAIRTQDFLSSSVTHIHTYTLASLCCSVTYLYALKIYVYMQFGHLAIRTQDFRVHVDRSPSFLHSRFPVYMQIGHLAIRTKGFSVYMQIGHLAFCIQDFPCTCRSVTQLYTLKIFYVVRSPIVDMSNVVILHTFQYVNLT